MGETREHFMLVGAENIREFVAKLNEKGLTKDDIVYISNPSDGSYYAIVYV